MTPKARNLEACVELKKRFEETVGKTCKNWQPYDFFSNSLYNLTGRLLLMSITEKIEYVVTTLF